MTQERHDPWALLREAHSFVDPYEGDLFERIHTALAAHEAEERVTWIPLAAHEAFVTEVNGYLVEVRPSYAGDGWWAWKAEQPVKHRDRQHGFKRTRELAEEAAIAAARGMR